MTLTSLWNKVIVATSLGVLAMIGIASFNAVSAQTQSAPPCCVDRWDPGWTERGMWGPGMMGQDSNSVCKGTGLSCIRAYRLSILKTQPVRTDT
jgi:hypothetical protein